MTAILKPPTADERLTPPTLTLVASPEREVEVVVTVRVQSYGHPDKVLATITADLERILGLAYRAGTIVTSVADATTPASEAAAVAAAAEVLRSCTCPGCDHVRRALDILEAAA
jgi:hypothetical protein